MNLVKRVGLLSVLLLSAMLSKTHSFKFAFVSDMHIGNNTAEEDLMG